MLSETFWACFLTTVVSCILVGLKLAYKSKCKTVECCCIKIQRDTLGEEKIDELNIELHNDENASEKKSSENV